MSFKKLSEIMTGSDMRALLSFYPDAENFADSIKAEFPLAGIKLDAAGREYVLGDVSMPEGEWLSADQLSDMKDYRRKTTKR